MSEMQAESFPAVLDLSSADTKGFDPIPAGTYDATVYEVTPIKTENPEGRLPLGTPGINIQFKIDGGPYDNRRVFNRYWMPPTDYDAEKRNKSLGMLARFLTAIGYDETEIKSGGFQLDLADMQNRECRVSVKVDTEYDNNKVTNVKPRQAVAEGSGGGVL